MRFIPFPRGISVKVNVTARLVFRLAYYNVAVQYVSHYAIRDSGWVNEKKCVAKVSLWCVQTGGKCINTIEGRKSSSMCVLNKILPTWVFCTGTCI